MNGKIFRRKQIHCIMREIINKSYKMSLQGLKINKNPKKSSKNVNFLHFDSQIVHKNI